VRESRPVAGPPVDTNPRTPRAGERVDVGLFGPDSVTWRLHADPMMGMAALRAVFLQALHPVAMAGVAANSAYQSDPWGRLARTGEYIGVTTYGTTDAALRAGAKLRGIHARMSVDDPDTGERRRVDDPELLLWVHATEVDSILDIARRSGAGVSATEGDRYVAEQVRAAELVGLDPSGVPHDTSALAAYLVDMRPRLRATRPAYDAVRFIAAPPMPWWIRYAPAVLPTWATVVTLGFGTLPRWARSLYTHLPALPTTDLTTTLSLRALRHALMALPRAVREGPHHRAAEQRLATAEGG